MVLAAALAALTVVAPAAASTELRFTVRAENMEPRLRIGDRVRFDSAAYATRVPAVGDIVLIRPPVGTFGSGSPEADGCARNTPDRELCVRAVPEPIRFITRVVAVGGDTIRFTGGRVIRNGKRETRKGIRLCAVPSECTYRRAITVPEGHVYLAGDNRGRSDDSRFWGAIPAAWVTARYSGMLSRGG